MSAYPDDVVRVLGLSGSLRRGSFNTRLLDHAATLLPAGADMVSFDSLRDVEPFDEDMEAAPAPAGVTSIRQAVREADAVLIATPEYNSSVPGQLKNALDWLSRSDSDTPGKAGSALYGKPVAVISTSPGRFGAAWAAQELRKILKAQGARVIEDSTVAIAAARDVFEGDSPRGLSNDENERLAQLCEALCDQVQLLRQAEATTAPQAVQAS